MSDGLHIPVRRRKGWTAGGREADLISVLAAAAVFAVFVVKPAQAYVDPGTATIAIQALLGAIAAGGIFFRHKLTMIGQFFRRKPRGDSQDRSGNQ